MSIGKLQFSWLNRQKTPVILQNEVAECGLACLAMVFSHHGFQIDLATLRTKHAVSSRGTNLQQLMDIAHANEFTTRPLRLELEELSQLQAPCVLHWDLNHFVVLKAVKGEVVHLIDPAVGERQLTLSEVSKHFTGVALELTPTPDFKAQDQRRRVELKQFWHKMVGLKSTLFYIFWLSLTLQAFALISPYYMQWVVDEVIVRADMSLLNLLAIGFALLMCLETIVTALRSWVIIRLSTLFNLQMASHLFKHLLKLPMDFFEKRHMGDIVSRFGSLGQIESLLTTGLVQAVVDGLMAITTLAMMLLYSVKLSLVVLLAVAGYLAIRLIGYSPLRNLTETQITQKAKENSNFMESIRGIQSIKLFSKESHRHLLWQNRYTESLNTGIRMGQLNIAFSSVNGLLFGLENLIVVYLAAVMVMNQTFSVGMLFAFMAYKRQFSGKAAALVEKAIELKMIGLHLERLSDIALTEAEKDTHAATGVDTPEQEFSGHLRLDNLSFAYQDDSPKVFQNVSLTLQPGESVALVGPSGCGKTTLAKIILGLFSPTEGTRYADDKPLEQWSMQQYRSQVGAVMQQDSLLSGSIAENISFFDPQIDMARVEEAAKLAQLLPTIAQLPMGFQTLIGDMGAALSGGQQQRLLLARALYRQPKLLVMDEATSHMDVALEGKINEAIKALSMTRLIIAHRPETILSADRVLELTPNGVHTLDMDQLQSQLMPGNALDDMTKESPRTDKADGGAKKSTASFADATFNSGSMTIAYKDPDKS